MPLPPPPEASIAQNRPETAIVREINHVRRTHGLRALRIDRRLTRVAVRHSRMMLRLDALTHAPTLRARMSGAARKRYSETLAWVPRGGGPRTVVTMWMNSAPHRAVVLDGNLRRIGVGRVLGAMRGSGGWAITADFTS
jgi:uncharacterized protein YkwD